MSRAVVDPAAMATDSAPTGAEGGGRNLVSGTPVLLLAFAAGLGYMWLDFDALIHWRAPFFPRQSADFRLWLLFYGIQVSIWTASLWVTSRPVRDLWRSQDAAARWSASLALAIAALLAFAVVLYRPDDVEKAMPFSTVPQQDSKGVAQILALSAAAFPMLGIALHRGIGRRLAGLEPLDRSPLLLEAQRQSREWLGWVGTIIGAGTLGSGALRRAMLAASGNQPGLFPVEEVVGYGLAFSFLVAVVYFPTARALEQAAAGIRDALLPAEGTAEDWFKARKEWDERLGIGADFGKSLTTGIGILGPLIGALLAQALPGK